MVKKKATRAKAREKKTIQSSARAAFIESKDNQDEQLWEEGMDIHIKQKKNELSEEEKQFQERRVNAKLTKKQKKRIEILKERKRKKEQRTELYERLQKHQLSNDQIQVLQSSARMGQTDTTKQKLKLALKKNRLGIESDPQVNLFQTVELTE